jgi:hypothetical protein
MEVRCPLLLKETPSLNAFDACYNGVYLAQADTQIEQELAEHLLRNTTVKSDAKFFVQPETSTT